MNIKQQGVFLISLAVVLLSACSDDVITDASSNSSSKGSSLSAFSEASSTSEDNTVSANSSSSDISILSSTSSSSQANNVIGQDGLSYQSITSSLTGRVWLDRNLGATRVCSSLEDEGCYGDYYQWGRDADGHEKSNSITTATQDSSGMFIIGHYDWSKYDESGINRSQIWNPCPSGFRVPTADEFKAENFANASDAFKKLKIPSSGYRIDSVGEVVGMGEQAYYWSISVDENSNVQQLYLSVGSGSVFPTVHRAEGDAIRCIAE